MKRIIMVAVLALVLISTSAHAARKGMYFSGNVGVSLLSDTDWNIPISFLTGEESYDLGFRIGGALGYDFGAFRVEGEIAYRTNDADEGTTVTLGTFVTSGPVAGAVTALSIMMNGYYDFHIAKSRWVPYLGGGMGFAKVESNIRHKSFATFIPIYEDSATVFAYQAMAGLGYRITRATTFTIDYRYFATSDAKLQTNIVFGDFAVPIEYSNHSLNLGVQVAF